MNRIQARRLIVVAGFLVAAGLDDSAIAEAKNALPRLEAKPIRPKVKASGGQVAAAPPKLGPTQAACIASAEAELAKMWLSIKGKHADGDATATKEWSEAKNELVSAAALRARCKDLGDVK